MSWWPALVSLLATVTGCLSAPPDVAQEDFDAAPTVIEPCAQPTLVTDDFRDMLDVPEFEEYHDDSGTASALMTGDSARLVAGTSGVAGFGTRHAFNLVDSRVNVEVSQIVVTDTDAVFGLVARRDDDNAVGIGQVWGKLHTGYTVNGALVDVPPVDYVPSQHRFWQLREADGTLYWEASEDGDSYVELHSEDTPFELTNVRFFLEVVADPNMQDGGEATLDNYMGGGEATGQWCPTASFRSAFDEPLPAAWRTYGPGQPCEISVTNDELLFELAANNTVTCGAVPRPLFDLRGSSLAARVRGLTSAVDSGFVILRADARTGGAEYVEMRYHAGGIEAVKYVEGDGSIVKSTPYVASEHEAWRIREEGGTIYFDTFDGETWANFADTTVPFALDAMEVHAIVVFQDEAPLESATSVRFDDLNLLPD